MTLILLPIHIIIALSSIGYTAYVLFRPSKKGLDIAYGLTGLTIATGTILVIDLRANLTLTCLEGLVYLSLMFAALVVARQRIAISKI